ncbi:MAG: DMT family transporter [Clostridiales bacterium]|jgi:drug/metabolite transporter (DMT)-like permease|nr:DMT family transporter [Clostridiales bacterium]
MTEMNSNVLEAKKIKAYAELLFVAFSWALSTVIIKKHIGDMPFYHLLMGRFTVGTLFIFALQPSNVARIRKQDLKVGIPLGILLFGAYAFGVICLKYTSASKSAFLISLSVLFIPLVETIRKKTTPSKWIIISVVLSLAGMVLISGINGTSFNYGDALAIASSIVYTMYVLTLDRHGKNIEDTLLTLIQLVIVSICFFIAAVLFEGFSINHIMNGLIPIIIIGVLCTGMATLFQTRAQKVASPEAAGILFLGEPLFTLIMSYFILKETILFGGLIGAALILSSLVIAVLKKV